MTIPPSGAGRRPATRHGMAATRLHLLAHLAEAADEVVSGLAAGQVGGVVAAGHEEPRGRQVGERAGRGAALRIHAVHVNRHLRGQHRGQRQWGSRPGSVGVTARVSGGHGEVSGGHGEVS